MGSSDLDVIEVIPEAAEPRLPRNFEDIVRITEDDLTGGRKELNFPKSIYVLQIFKLGERYSYHGVRGKKSQE